MPNLKYGKSHRGLETFFGPTLLYDLGRLNADTIRGHVGVYGTNTWSIFCILVQR